MNPLSPRVTSELIPFKNHNESTCPIFNTPTEIQLLINRFMPFGDQVRLSKTCKYAGEFYESEDSWKQRLRHDLRDDSIAPLGNHVLIMAILKQHGLTYKQIFDNYPGCRTESFQPANPNGQHFFENNLGLNFSPKMLRQIKNGQLTIEGASTGIEKATEQLNAFCQKYPQNHSLRRTTYAINWKMLIPNDPAADVAYFGPLFVNAKRAIIKYIADGSMTLEQLDKATPYSFFLLENPFIQRCIDNRGLDLAFIIEASPEQKLLYLTALFFQTQFSSGNLTLEKLKQLPDLTKRSFVAFSDESVCRAIENKEITAQQVFGTTGEEHTSLILKNTKKYIELVNQNRPDPFLTQQVRQS